MVSSGPLTMVSLDCSLLKLILSASASPPARHSQRVRLWYVILQPDLKTPALGILPEGCHLRAQVRGAQDVRIRTRLEKGKEEGSSYSILDGLQLYGCKTPGCQQNSDLKLK